MKKKKKLFIQIKTETIKRLEHETYCIRTYLFTVNIFHSFKTQTSNVNVNTRK